MRRCQLKSNLLKSNLLLEESITRRSSRWRSVFYLIPDFPDHLAENRSASFIAVSRPPRMGITRPRRVSAGVSLSESRSGSGLQSVRSRKTVSGAASSIVAMIVGGVETILNSSVLSGSGWNARRDSGGSLRDRQILNLGLLEGGYGYSRAARRRVNRPSPARHRSATLVPDPSAPREPNSSKPPGALTLPREFGRCPKTAVRYFDVLARAERTGVKISSTFSASTKS
jgi:hypothetical protein